MFFKLRPISLALLLACISFLFMCGPVSADSSQATVISFSGRIDQGSSMYAERALRSAERNKSGILVVEINSSGGDITSCRRIKSLLLSFTGIPKIAWINGKAVNESALIAFSCDKIFMSPDSVIGSDGSNKELSSELEALFAGRFLTAASASSNVITARQANDLSFAAPASSYNEFLNSDSDNIDYVTPKPFWMELLGNIVFNPVFAVIILILGVTGAIKEMLAPGHGIGATMAFVFLGLFFGGKLVSGSAVLIAALLMALGLVLMIIEVFFVPGVGLPAAAGFVCIIASIILSFDDLRTGVSVASLVIIGTLALLIILFNYIVKNKNIFSKFVTKPLNDGTSDVIHDVIDFDMFAGKAGKSVTDLKPTGKAEIEGKVVDVITRGSFLPKDSPLEVVSVEGNKIVVALKQ